MFKRLKNQWWVGLCVLLAIGFLLLVNQCQKPATSTNTATPAPLELWQDTARATKPLKPINATVKAKKMIADTVITIKIQLVGDLMCHKPQINNAKKSDSTYDFTPSFVHVKPYFAKADFVIGNLETTFAGPKVPYAGYPAFNSPDAFAEALKNAGFHFLVTANNHSMDTGEKGLLRTLKTIEKNDLLYTGTFYSQKDHDKIRIISIKGVKTAILNYTYGTNGNYPKKEHSFMLNLIDSAKIYNQVFQSLELGADIVLVYYHFGVENQKEPTKDQKKAVKWALDAGAKLIIGAHPHVIGPVEKVALTKGMPDTAFVAYSLGNFISNQYWRYADAGVILQIEIKKNTTSKHTRFVKAQYLPTWVYRGQNSGYKQHVVLPAQWVFTDSLLPYYITKDLKEKMLQAFEDTKIILTKNKNSFELIE